MHQAPIHKHTQKRTHKHKHDRTSDAIVRAIEDDIAQGALRDDSMLPAERELMARFSASRTVVREAIAALANRGLLETQPRHRPIVKRAGYEGAIKSASPIIQQLLCAPEGIKNLYKTRAFVEKALVREAALKADKHDIKALREALAKNQDAIPQSHRFFDTDIEFHRVFYTVAANPVFMAIQQGFVSWLAPQWQKMPNLPARNQLNFEAHKAIFEAILARDPDAAEAALEAHLDTAWLHLAETFES